MSDTSSVAAPPGAIVVSPGGRRLPRLPALDEALGAVTPSPTVAAASTVLVDTLHDVDYGWLFALRGRPASRATLTIVEYYGVRDDDLQNVVRVLAHTGYAGTFFTLAAPSNDDGLRDYLLAHGVLWDQVLHYFQASAWDGARFVASFLAGIGYSIASVLEVLADLFGFIVGALQRPEEAWQAARTFVDGLLALRAEALIEMARGAWNDWQRAFADALLRLDFDRAGFMLGKLAGDLWQLLTGLRALAKLPGLAVRTARRFGVLMVDGARLVRQAAVAMAQVLTTVAEALAKAVTYGLRAIVTFFEDTAVLVQRFKAGALVIVEEATTLFCIPEGGLAIEGLGFLEEGFVLADTSGPNLVVLARVRAGFEQGRAYIDSLTAGLARSVRRIPNKAAFAREVALIEAKAEELVRLWRNTLAKLIREHDIPLNPKEFGKWVHGTLEHAFEDLAAAMSKVYSSIAEIEITMLCDLLADTKAEAKLFRSRAGESLLAFVKRHPQLLAELGVSDEKGLLALLKRMGYQNPAKTVIGDLVCDGVLYDSTTRRLVSVDWTSGGGRTRFALAFEAAMEEGKNLSEAERIALAQKFLTHTMREYGLRKAILASIFDGWEVEVVEVLYTPLRVTP